MTPEEYFAQLARKARMIEAESQKTGQYVSKRLPDERLLFTSLIHEHKKREK